MQDHFMFCVIKFNCEVIKETFLTNHAESVISHSIHETYLGSITMFTNFQRYCVKIACLWFTSYSA